jgi:hypothetical protein
MSCYLKSRKLENSIPVSYEKEEKCTFIYINVHVEKIHVIYQSLVMLLK